MQKVYTADGRIDETLTVRDGELVSGPGRLSSGGGRAWLQRLLPECAGGLGAFAGRLRRPRLCMGAGHVARERPAPADGDKVSETASKTMDNASHDDGAGPDSFS